MHGDVHTWSCILYARLTALPAQNASRPVYTFCKADVNFPSLHVVDKLQAKSRFLRWPRLQGSPAPLRSRPCPIQPSHLNLALPLSSDWLRLCPAFSSASGLAQSYRRPHGGGTEFWGTALSLASRQRSQEPGCVAREGPVSGGMAGNVAPGPQGPPGGQEGVQFLLQAGESEGVRGEVSPSKGGAGWGEVSMGGVPNLGL